MCKTLLASIFRPSESVKKGCGARFASAKPKAQDFKSVLGRVKDLVNKATAHIMRYPDAGGKARAHALQCCVSE